MTAHDPRADYDDRPGRAPTNPLRAMALAALVLVLLAGAAAVGWSFFSTWDRSRTGVSAPVIGPIPSRTTVQTPGPARAPVRTPPERGPMPREVNAGH